MVRINNQFIRNKNNIAIIHNKKITIGCFKQNIQIARTKIEYTIREIINKITTGKKTQKIIKIISIIRIINLIINNKNHQISLRLLRKKKDRDN